MKMPVFSCAMLVLSIVRSGNGQETNPSPDDSSPSENLEQIELDSTPSDPAAVGFLTGIVDRLVYSPENDGLVEFSALAKVRWIGPPPLPPNIDAPISIDFSKGTTRVNWPNHIQKEYWSALQEQVFALLHLTMRHSREATQFIATLEHDGKELRVDYKPRSNQFQPRTCWYREDGLPLRVRQESKNPLTGKVNVVDSEYEYAEIEGRKVRTRRVDKCQGISGEWRYEYAAQNGYLLLCKVSALNSGVGMTIEYDSFVLSPANANQTQKPTSGR